MRRSRSAAGSGGLTRKAARALGLFAAFAALFFCAPSNAAVFYPEAFTLANGLQVVVVQNRLSQAVSHMVWYKAGSADEDPGRSGLAHYLEHMMFRGTAAVPPGGFSRIIAAQGGNDNAFTSRDFTAYYANVAADRLPLVMQMEADRMQKLRITPDVAEPELNVVLSERQQRIDNKPEGLFAERMQAALFPGHPYGIPVIGHAAEIAAITPAMAQDFYRRHYAPNNAVVVISGNVDMNEVMRLAAGTYGRVPPRGVFPRRDLPAVGEPREKRVLMTDARVRQPYVTLRAAAPSYATGKGREAYAYEVLQEILDGGEVGVLYRELVVRQRLASAISVSYDPQVRGPSVFAITAMPQPGIGAHEVEKGVRDVLGDLARKGAAPKETERAKTRLARRAVFARDSLMTPGYVFGQGLVTGQTIEDIETWPQRIERVSASDVTRALRALNASRNRVTGMLLPGPEDEKR